MDSYPLALSEMSLVRSFDSKTLALEEDYVLCYGPLHRPTVLNSSGLILLSLFERTAKASSIPSTWWNKWGDDSIYEALRQMYSARLLVQENCSFPDIDESLGTLAAWLHVTNRCNLRCDYCYVPHRCEDMPFEIGRAAIKATIHSAITHNCHHVKLKYAGGEPLLRFPLVTELHQYAQSLALREGLTLDGVVLSNGTLLNDRIAKTMQSLGLRLMISLDGYERWHDVQRHYAGGKSSFGDVWSGILIALDHDLVHNISITVSGRNADGLPELVDWLLDHNLPFSFNFYRENDFSSHSVDLRLSEDKIVKGMLAAYRVIEDKLPLRSLLSTLDRADFSTPHVYACGAGRNYIAFDPHGRVAKCQMQLHKPVATICNEDPLALMQADEAGLQNIPVENKKGCYSCEWKYWCGGGCPLVTFMATGQYDVKSPNCHIYKALYPEAIRLEGLRLLKYSDSAMRTQRLSVDAFA